jgi:predicted nucleotidyltransferase
VTLEQLLATVSGAVPGRSTYAIIGAVARNAWAPPRATTDVDLTVAAEKEALRAIAEALGAIGYVEARAHRTDPADPLPDILVFRSETGRPRQLDVLVAKTPFERSVLERAVSIRIGSIEVPVATPEDIVVYKLLANRPRDQEDIRAILRTQRRAQRILDWSYVERWTSFWQIGDRLAQLRREEE